MEPSSELACKLKDSLLSLGLLELPEDWVEDVWSSHFTEEKEFPSEFMSNRDINELYLCIIEAGNVIEKWYYEGKSKATQVVKNKDRYGWSQLRDLDVSCHGFIGFLSLFIKINISEVENINAVLAAFSAAKIYMYLVSLPDAAFDIFKEAIFEDSLNLLKVVSKMNIGKKIKKSKSKTNKNSDHDKVKQINTVDENNISTGICSLLVAVSESLNVIKLGEYVLSLNRFIRSLVNFTAIEENTNVFVIPPEDNTIAKAVLTAYEIIKKICREEHGNTAETIEVIFYACREIYYITDDNFTETIRMDNTLRRQHMFQFLVSLLKDYPEETQELFVGFLQQTFIRAPERAEHREKLVNEIFLVITLLPPIFAREFCLWIGSAMFAEKNKHKVFVAELLSKLLNAPDHTDLPRIHAYYIMIILAGSLDKNSLVRHKCMHAFANCVLSTRSEVRSIMEKLFVNPSDVNDSGPLNLDLFPQIPGPLLEEIGRMPMQSVVLPENPLPPASQIVKMMELFRTDEKAYVRKSALLSLTNIVLFDSAWVNKNRVEAIVKSCKNTSLMIRKLAMKCLTDVLLKYPDNHEVISAWVEGLIPLTLDSDSKCQEKAIETVYGILIENLAPYKRTTSPESQLPWQVMRCVVNQEKSSLLRTSFRTWAHKKMITDHVLRCVVTHIDTENGFPAWSFVVLISEYLNYPRPEFISDYYFSNIYLKDGCVGNTIEQLVLEALFLNVKHMKEEQKEYIYNQFKTALESHQIPATSISYCLDTMRLLKPAEVKEWCASLVETCGNFLIETFAPGNSAPIDVHKFTTHVFLLGEAAMVRPGVKEEVVRRLAFAMECNLNKRTGKTSVCCSAWCVITLTKLCLQENMLAKKYVPRMVALLNNRTSPTPVKINVLTGLADICVKYTSVIEDYIGVICLALKDESARVRKTALTYIIQLIMEDYLKLRPPIFFYLLTTMLDPVEEIRLMYSGFIEDSALKKNPGVLTSYFAQTIFFLNSYEGRYGYDKTGLSPNEKLYFGLEGVLNFENRATLYKFMLRAMGDMERFKVQNALCEDLLGRFCEGKIKLDLVGCSVLKDTLNALASEEMRLESLRKDNEETPIEDNVCEDYVLGMARKMTISQLLKKSYMETFVPTVGKLKRILYKKKSPLAEDLMICVREVMKEFRKEVDEIFASDQEMAKEVAFDLRYIPSPEPTFREEFEEANPDVHVHASMISQMATNETFRNLISRNSGAGQVNDDEVSESDDNAAPSVIAGPSDLAGSSPVAGRSPVAGPSGTGSSQTPSRPCADVSFDVVAPKVDLSNTVCLLESTLARGSLLAGDISSSSPEEPASPVKEPPSEPSSCPEIKKKRTCRKRRRH